MLILNFLVVICGLCVFEVISSIDNAVVNAYVLRTVPEKFRKFFLSVGLIFAVFVVRGVLPFTIIWAVNPSLSIGQIISFAFSNNPEIENSINLSKPLLLLGGGTYLFLIFLAWLFLEEKKYAFLVESFIHRQGIWFYALSAIFLTSIIYFSLKINPLLALAASIGSAAFFIADGFKKNAEEQEKRLLSPNVSAWSKILYLEILDISFSIDGVIGAFAFTLSVPLILLGNGLGAWVVRQVTIKGVNLVTKFAYLKNGAMYSIGVLGSIMILESFGKEFPFWLAPLNTFLLLGTFLYLSYKQIKAAEKAK